MNVGDMVKWTPETMRGVSPVSPLLQPYYLGLVIEREFLRRADEGQHRMYLHVISGSGRKCRWKSWQCEVISEAKS
jgi:hypothetical protein